jgi:hypothetical protein
MKNSSKEHELIENPELSEGGIALFYQRPVADLYHGGSSHVRGFVRALSRYTKVSIVAPAVLGAEGAGGSSVSVPISVSNIIRAFGECVKFVAREGTRRSSKRVRAIIIFDVYAGLIPLIWGRISGIPIVYYAQDWGARILNDLTRLRTKGRTTLRLFRAPLERLLLVQSDLFAVVSEPMRQDFERLGIPPERIVVCELPRERVIAAPERVTAWRRRLGTEGSVSLVFIGNLGYPPNRRAVEYALSRIAPRLNSTRNRAKLILVGAGTDSLELASGNVVGVGPVTDLDNLLYGCQIGLAPMEVEGGISGKIVDYLIHGLTVVATPEAQSGVISNSATILANLDEFAETVCGLIDHEPPPLMGLNRVVDSSVVRHYFSDAGVQALYERIGQTLRTRI